MMTSPPPSLRAAVATALAALAAAVVLVAPASAATITVETTEDSLAPAKCSWRDALEAANHNVIEGKCPAGESSAIDFINFNLPPESTITLTMSPPSVTGPTVIEGPGASQLTISGNDERRVFEDSNTTITISGLTIAHGACGEGCGIRNIAKLTLEGVVVAHNTASASGGVSIFPAGGGIQNAGTLTLRDSTVVDNTAVAKGASSQNGPEGGGIYNTGELNLERSTVSGNLSMARAEGGNSTNAIGGGIYNAGKLEVLRSTVSGNEATAAEGTGSNDAQGGGVFDSNAGSVEVMIANSTISGNLASASGTSASGKGGGITAEPSSTSFAVRNSTIADNTAASAANAVLSTIATFSSTIVANPQGGGANCSGAGTSIGFNLTDGTGCGFTQPTDQTSTDPLLSPLGLLNNGGSTKTIALQEGSPAIDKGLSMVSEGVDQRGLTRPVEIPGVANAPGGDGTDIGAFEVQLPSQPVGPGPGASTGPIPSTPAPKPAPTVTIKGLAPTSHKRDLKIRFTSSVPGSSFRCKLDNKPYKPCRSPFRAKGLNTGRHRFSVIATSPAGISSKPAKKSFRVLAAK